MNKLTTRRTRLQIRRKFRRRRRQVEDMGVQAEQHLEQHFFKRIGKLFEVRRFILGWIMLLVLLVGGVTLQLRALGGYYQNLQPIAGGTYAEGMIGSFTNASPLFATGLVDNTVSRLVFAGLLKYNSANQLVGDLAEKYKTDADGKIYTVTLRPNLKWHDGRDLTADDVVFTFKTIQNPDARSPLFHAWQGIDVKATDARTIIFTLSSSLAPFVYGLTTGIVPKHSLQSIPAPELRSSAFNTSKPVGAGPFVWDTIEIVANGKETNLQQIGLKAFADYHNGRPKLDQFVIKTFGNENQMITSFQRKEVNGLVGLDRAPEIILKDQNVRQHNIPLTAETMVFFRTNSDMLKDARVRQALVQAVNVPQIVTGLDSPVIVADEPLLRGQLGYSTALRQLPTNIENANKLLDDAGWKKVANESVRSNGTAKLSLKFFAQNNADYIYVTQQLQKAWQAIGVETEVTLPTDSDLQSAINSRSYDALLYGISVGVDPDVFAYWHSTQASAVSTSRLNFSNYASTVADKSLEAGRSRTDASLRAAKYTPFLQAWRADAPALALYQPRFLYVTHGQLFGFAPKTVNTATDRFNNVENWMIKQDYMLKP